MMAVKLKRAAFFAWMESALAVEVAGGACFPAQAASGGPAAGNAAAIIDLSGAWRLTQTDAPAKSYPAAVPGGVHAALLDAGAIPDPFWGRNEQRVLWVGEKDWTFSRSFDLEAAFLGNESVILRVEDCDTFATIAVNGHAFPRTCNRFRRWDFDVKPYLRAGRNEISATFDSAVRVADEEAATRPRRYSCSNGVVKNISSIRKPQCHGGWDWGLAQMETGFMGMVALIGCGSHRIDYTWCDQAFNAAMTRCDLTVTAQVTASRSVATDLRVAVAGVTAAKPVKLEAGTNLVSVAVTVERPELWWPAGEGAQRLYALTVDVGGARVEKRIGFRTIRLESTDDVEPNTGAKGRGLRFVVNGRPVFAKGTSWIPCDAFENRQTPEKYRELLTAAAWGNCNVIRVWGGGKYERELFYDLCDELGLMVWQDFMFACGTYPADERFLANLRPELEHQVKRIRDHASLALWCGDNECLAVLHMFPEARADQKFYVAEMNRRAQAVADAVKAFDPTRSLWPSSPSAGDLPIVDANYPPLSVGDCHYWHVWGSTREGLDAFYAARLRFCSEFGYQSYSSEEVARRYVSAGDVNPTAPDFEYHQKEPEGSPRMIRMLMRYFRMPEKPSGFCYLTQVQQALAVKTGAEFWRTLRPWCMGAIYWQLADVWPVASWSSIEYGGKFKPLMHQVRRSFAPVLVTGVPHDRCGLKEFSVWGVNDLQKPLCGELRVELTGFDGRMRRALTSPAKIPAASSVKLASFDADAFSDAERDACFVRYSFTVAGRELTANDWFFAPWKACPLAKPVVKAKPEGFEVTLTTDKPAFFVWLETPGLKGHFDENFLTLLPGRPVKTVFRPRNATLTPEDFAVALRVTHLANEESEITEVTK